MDTFKKNNEILEGIAKGLDAFLEVSAAFRTRSEVLGRSNSAVLVVAQRTHLPVVDESFADKKVWLNPRLYLKTAI